MIHMGIEISRNYAVDIALLYQVRAFRDGVSFFDLSTNLDLYKADHTPGFSIRLIVLNIMLLDFSIYYRWHRNGNEENT